MATLKDVARAAGVSFKTVSRVVNRDPAVGALTRQRVTLAIEALGYVPDGRARAMRAGRTGIVALVTDRITTTPYSVSIVRGAQRAASEHGVTLLLADIDGDPAALQPMLTRLREARVDGIAYATMFHRPLVETIAADVPLAFVNCYSNSDAPAFVPDDEAGEAEATRHLVALGHRRIAYVTLPRELVATSLRGQGYEAVMRASGLEPVMREGKLWNGGAERSVAYQVISDLLTGPAPPTALLLGNDEQAFEAYAAARDLGLVIPRDLSVFGFDDASVICEGLRPRLTTMALPYEAMGSAAIHALFEAGATSGRQALPCRLVARDSTAPPKPGNL